MKIIELNIIEFGCLKDRKITFGDRLNILYGENEAGKSTILLFIKYMLYGLPKKSAQGIERERSVSFDGKSASGSMPQPSSMIMILFISIPVRQQPVW